MVRLGQGESPAPDTLTPQRQPAQRAMVLGTLVTAGHAAECDQIPLGSVGRGSGVRVTE